MNKPAKNQKMNPTRKKPLPCLIAALMKPSAYDHSVKKCELIETHASWVILTGTVAYKIKKPVNLGFLDFSTLEKRRFCCEEELRLNRRLAPEIYLGLAPVFGTRRTTQMDRKRPSHRIRSQNGAVSPRGPTGSGPCQRQSSAATYRCVCPSYRLVPSTDRRCR